MLTPRFKLSQDEDHVFITIHAPYTNIAETDIDVDGYNLLFVSSPYFLRLRLPGKVIESEQANGSYSSDSGDFNLVFDKDTPGEYFENLDMITSLLAPKDIPDVNPSLVEVLEEDGITLEPDNSTSSNDPFTYGFANKLKTEFSHIGTEFPQIFELKVPEQVAVDERHELRVKTEDGKFSFNHYLADYYDEEIVEPYLKAKLVWQLPDFNNTIEFTEEEVAILKEIPNKSYLLNKTEYNQVLYGLIDILYGYCYDKRTTLNESTVETSWTINKLSATLSWFCVYTDIKQALITCYRRALIYPIFRNYEICNLVKNDVITLLQKGKKFVIKCIIEVHQMFNSSSDARYILNELYIKDYLVFLQKCRSEEFQELFMNISNIEITKGELGLEIEELEYAAMLVEEESNLENEMTDRMASMTLAPGQASNMQYFSNSESDSTSSDSSSDSSSDDSSSSDLDSDDDLP